jgi:hypothetical protein
LGSAELFPQNCQVPNLSPNAHLKGPTKELQTETEIAIETPKGHCLIKSLAKAIKAILMPTNAEEQWVATDVVIENTPSDIARILSIQQILDAPAIMHMQDPTAKQNLITSTRIHCKQTQNNTLGALPKITQAAPALIQLDPCPTTTEKQQSTRVYTTTSPVIIIPPARVPGGVRASTWLISQQALTVMTLQEALTIPISFTPRKLVLSTYDTCSNNNAHFAAPMIHPMMSEIISSYKRLMNDPATAKVWQMGFGKDFDGMVQGDIKTGPKGTNSVFVMMRKDIDGAMVAGFKWTYARIVVDLRPPKEDPN